MNGERERGLVEEGATDSPVPKELRNDSRSALKGQLAGLTKRFSDLSQAYSHLWNDNLELRQENVRLKNRLNREVPVAPYRRLSDREAIIGRVVEENRTIKGMAYCELIHAAGLKPRRDWVDRGCPATYPTAYRVKEWRKLVHAEKWRAMRRRSQNKV